MRRNLLGAVAFAGLLALQISSTQAQPLPELVVTNFGSFPLRDQTSLINNNPGVNSSYSVTGGGDELWGPSDKGLFGYFPVTGDFDIRVRVESLEPVHRYAKTGLMVREFLSSSSRMVSLFATPTGPTELPLTNPVGEDEVEFNFRRGVGDGSNNINLGSPGYPNAWLRLARRGSVVYGLVSQDGVNWTKSASVDTATWLGGQMRANVILGIGSSSHDDNRLVESELRDFSRVEAVGPVQITSQPKSRHGVIDGTVDFSVAVSDPVDAEYQWLADGVVIPGATAPAYTTPALTAASDGTTYTVEVTGGDGTKVTSSGGTVSIATIEPPSFPFINYDFDDGELPFGGRAFGTAHVDPAAGAGGSGALVLAAAANQQDGSFVIEDFNGGMAVDSFVASFKLKIGPSTSGTRVADGFSFSFGPGVPLSLFPAPQQGVGTGLAVSFDIYDNHEGEAPAIDVFYGVDPANYPVNYKGNILHHPIALSDLVQSRYVDVIIRMNADGKLDILFDGQVIAYQLQTPFVPVADGKFGFGAYAGGYNAFHGVDDIQIETTMSTGGAYLTSLAPIGSNTAANPEIRATIVNLWTSLDQGSVELRLDGELITPTFNVDEVNGTTTISHEITELLAPGSTHEVTLKWRDSEGAEFNNSASFTVGNYATIPSQIAGAPGSGVADDSGFKILVYQIMTPLTASSAFAESVLAGEQGGNVADPVLMDPISGYIVEPSVTGTINFDVNSAPLGFSTYPGIPGVMDSKENFVSEILAFIEFPEAGFYQMGVRSDDGFSLSAGPENNRVVLGGFEGERIPADTIIGFVVPQAGVYPFRLVHYQARGGSSIRWFSINENGEQVLINDPDNPTALNAFRTAEGGGTVATSISVLRSGTTLILSWEGDGTLESTSSLSNPNWAPVQGALNPYVLPNPSGNAFFRVSQ